MKCVFTIYFEFEAEAPVKGEDFEEILDDVKTKIVPGIVHWSHPNFYAYFPTGSSYPSVLGELMSAGLSGLSFSWVRNERDYNYLLRLNM